APAAPATAGPLACEGATLTVDTAAALHLVVKAPGFEHATTDVAAGARGSESLPLAAVPTPEATADYATGFDGADVAADVAAFRALGVPFHTELGDTVVVKFYVDDLWGASGPPTLYLQDTRDHLLHFDFYRDVLGGTLSRTAFEQATYHGADRTAAAGTLVLYDDLTSPWAAPVALTFFPSDDLTPAMALRIHQLIEARLPFLAPEGAADRLVYLPAGAVQEAAATAADADFARADAPWVDHEQLYGALTEQLLNPGVAFGTLRRLAPEDLAHTVVSYTDVLLLTRLPNDLPIVGGTITEELQTPLAHVNVAARARGTPNLALLSAGEHPDIAPLIGEMVRFEVTTTGWSVRAATLDEAKAFWESRAPEPFTPTADLTVEGLLDFDDIGFADATAVGVKAANVAELHHLLPNAAPDGFAVPFSAYDHFMATAEANLLRCNDARTDCLKEGRTEAVCEAARALCLPPDGTETLSAHVDRLLGDADFQADAELREASLDGLRWIIRHVPVDADFGAALDAHVVARFGAGARIRLRSSTNAEDLPTFSGAGLYSSYGADATGDDVASADIRKVWASAWNWRAFEERAFWNIDQRAIRMGVAVHPAYTDEQANGVLITRNLADPTIEGFYVNVQEGEVAVTNPESGVVPEVFTIVGSPAGGVQVIRQRFSSLSPDAPLLSTAEVARLYLAAAQIRDHFAPLYGERPDQFAVDIEFKFHGPDRALAIKQARPYHDAAGATP
ncbi:MAG: hypothetical protein EP329_05660, partial [Deltaproteobacteria bacterium]